MLVSCRTSQIYLITYEVELKDILYLITIVKLTFFSFVVFAAIKWHNSYVKMG